MRLLRTYAAQQRAYHGYCPRCRTKLDSPRAFDSLKLLGSLTKERLFWVLQRIINKKLQKFAIIFTTSVSVLSASSNSRTIKFITQEFY